MKVLKKNANEINWKVNTKIDLYMCIFYLLKLYFTILCILLYLSLQIPQNEWARDMKIIECGFHLISLFHIIAIL